MQKKPKVQKKQRSRHLRVLGIIPARGGFQSIPRKNIKELAGKPLLHYMVDAALKSGRISRVVVSSDDDEILDVARAIHEDVVLVKRPAHLAEDDTPDVPVLQHAIQEMEQSGEEPFDYIVMLHATSPFFEARHIDGALDMLLKDESADSVVSVYPVSNMHPKKLKRLVGERLDSYVPGYDESTTSRRQDMEPVYKRNAGLYAAKRDVVMKQGRVWGDHCLAYIMEHEHSLDVDTPHDFLIADLLMRYKNNQLGI